MNSQKSIFKNTYLRDYDIFSSQFVTSLNLANGACHHTRRNVGYLLYANASLFVFARRQVVTSMEDTSLVTQYLLRFIIVGIADTKFLPQQLIKLLYNLEYDKVKSLYYYPYGCRPQHLLNFQMKRLWSRAILFFPYLILY